ncbi:hypothetical protein LCGC14_1601600 [marine sediment metagenome]|uniref:Helix-turn-helix type 11 domain-containing protein n=1 Tax=marine sediment metagenome TaxID=412755 RepID=A0A0F9IB03_9ZZZZ
MKDVETLDTTVEEWREEVHKLRQSSDMNGLTIAELMQSLNLTRWGANELVRRLTVINRCKRGFSTRKNIHGWQYRVAVYQLIPKEEKK